MVDLVHVLIDGAMVEELVHPVVPGVFDHQTTHHLQTQHVPEGESGDVMMT